MSGESSSSTAPARDAVAAAAVVPVYYPANCFHLSPTLNTWCPLRAADVAGLTRFADFESQNVFFHLNHPIRFVRVAGVVVASTEYSKAPDRYIRHVYMIDDGSGATVPCFASDEKAAQAVRAAGRARAAEPEQAEQAEQPDQTGQPGQTTGQTAQTAPDLWRAPAAPPRGPPRAKKASAFIPPGTVLDVKGELQRFGDGFQIHVRKATPLRSTAQEAQVWAKMHAFARDTLARPWVLDRAVERACRRAARRARARGRLAEAAAVATAAAAADKSREAAASSTPSRTSPAKKATSGTPESRDERARPTAWPPRQPPRKKWQITPD